MPALYELAASYKNIAGLLDDATMDPETITSALAVIEDDIQAKAQNIAVILQAMGADVKIIKDEEERLANRRKAIENGLNHLKRYLFEQMEAINLPKIKTATFSINIQNNPPAVQITDEKAIPAKFLTIIPQTTVPDKKLIAAALKAGENVAGCEIVQGKSLRIR